MVTGHFGTAPTTTGKPQACIMSTEAVSRIEAMDSTIRLAYALISSLGLMMIAIAATLMGPAFPSMMQEFVIPYATLGLVASIWNVGYVVTPIGGAISDRYGEPIVLATSFVATLSAVGLASIAGDFFGLLGLFLVAGMGAAFGEVSMNSLLSKLYPRRRGFALNVLHLFFSLGAFLGPMLSGFLIASYGSWRLPYLVTCIAGIPLSLVAIMLVLKTRLAKCSEVPSREVVPQPDGQLLDAFFNGRALLVAGFFYFSAEVGANAWLPTFLIFERGFTIELASVSIGLFWAFMALGRLVLGNLADRVGYRKLIFSCALASAISILAAIFVEETHLIIALWCFSGFALGPIMPTIFAWTTILFPNRRGLATGVVYSVGLMGGVFSPWLMGALADLYNLEIAALCMTLSAFAIAGVALTLRRDSQH